MFTVTGLGNLDPGSDRAAFRQIADHLRAVIEQGELREGDQLPSEAQLMEHYGVARMTVRNALQQLQAEGLTFSQHGRGVYVRSRPPVRRLASDRFARRHREVGKAAFIAEADKVGAKPGVDMIRVSEEDPAADIAERLGLRGDDRAVVRRRRYLLDGRPVELATVTRLAPAGTTWKCCEGWPPGWSSWRWPRSPARKPASGWGSSDESRATSGNRSTLVTRAGQVTDS